MAFSTKISNALAIIAADAVTAEVDIGAGTAVVRIYDGSQPADADTAVGAQVLLAEINLPNPAFGAAADASPGGQCTAQGVPLTETSAIATGTAAWFRVIDRNGDTMWDGSVGASGSFDMLLASTSIVAGTEVTITSWTVTFPES